MFPLAVCIQLAGVSFGRPLVCGIVPAGYTYSTSVRIRIRTPSRQLECVCVCGFAHQSCYQFPGITPDGIGGDGVGGGTRSKLICAQQNC